MYVPTYTYQSVPTSWAEAFITKGKKRIKQHDGTVYLKNGDEYEIELFNPTAGTILAEISLDGKRLSGGGIVLRPGERVFLERYLDTARKFKFSTYEVEEGNAVVDNAIANNGRVSISFFAEIVKATPKSYDSLITRSSSTVNTDWNSHCTFTTTSAYCNYSSQIDTQDLFMASAKPVSTKSLRKKETGLTEQGTSSDQKFKEVDANFSAVPFYNVEWIIKPESTKKYTAEEVAVAYCSECGAKRKKSSFKFCPHCGTKF